MSTTTTTPTTTLATTLTGIVSQITSLRRDYNKTVSDLGTANSTIRSMQTTIDGMLTTAACNSKVDTALSDQLAQVTKALTDQLA